MTEEERLLYLEQKQLAEEEMRKNKEDLLTQFLKVYPPIIIRHFFLITTMFHLANRKICFVTINLE